MTERDIIINYTGLRVIYPLLLTYVSEICTLSTDFFKNPQISNNMKFRPVGDELIHADGRMDGRMKRQTDLTQLIVTFRNFASAPKKKSFLPHN